MKSWWYVFIGLLGICGAGKARGWNVLNTNSSPSKVEVVARLDLKGGPCTVYLKGNEKPCQQQRSAAPVSVELRRLPTVYPDGARYDTLSIVRVGGAGGAQEVLLMLDERKTSADGRGFEIVQLRFVPGRNGWLDVETLEHALPGKNDKPFMPGPPDLFHYGYDGGRYVRRGP